MKSFFIVVFSTCVTILVAAPVQDSQAETTILQRTKRSQYGPSYGVQSPCSAGSAPIAAYAHPTPYQLNIAPSHGAYGGYAGYGGGYSHHASAPYSGYGIGGPHYRAEDSFDEASEMMSFSDMDQGMMMEHPSARAAYSYDSAPAGIPGVISGLSGYGDAAGPAYGVFPNAHVSGCNVPLLLTCSPSIVPGKLVKSHQHYDGVSSSGASIISGAGHSPNVYRGADDMKAQKTNSKEEARSKEKQASHEQAPNH